MIKIYVLAKTSISTSLMDGESIIGILDKEGNITEPFIMIAGIDPHDGNQKQGSGSIRPFPCFFPIEVKDAIIPKDKIIIQATPPQALIDFYKQAKTKTVSNIVTPNKSLLVPK